MTSTVMKSPTCQDRLPKPLKVNDAAMKKFSRRVRNFNVRDTSLCEKVLIALLKDVAQLADISYVKNRLRCEGSSFLTEALPALGKGLYRALADGFWSPIPSFGSRGGKYVYPRFLSSLFCRVFNPDGSLKREPCVSSVKFIAQCCAVAYKADGGTMDPEKVRLKLLSLVETEKDLKDNWNEDVFARRSTNPFFTTARQIVNQVIPPVPAVLPGRPGPGAVADLKREESRFDASIPYHPSYASLISRFGFFLNDEHMFDTQGSARYPNCFDSVDVQPKAVTSEIVLVPKDSRGPRVIAKEPWALQWMQQGIKDWIVNVIQQHPLTAGKVNFDDQTVNREVAREGSISRAWSTLDLKDASDRISLGLIHSLFKDTDLLPILEATRSQFTSFASVKEEYDNLDDIPLTLRLEKFAPMGSAMCFPILSISCFALAVSAIQTATGMSIERCAEHVRVYGDDIAVGTFYVPVVIAALEYAGLLVNKEKSFVDSRFLESCGYDSFDGYDISPIRLKAVPGPGRVDDKDSPTVLVSLLERANAFYERGYLTAAQLLYEQVEKVLGPLMYGNSTTPLLTRRVPDCFADLVPELNFVTGRGAYSGSGRGKTYEGFTSWALRSPAVEIPTTGYGHLLRTWNKLGKGDPLPAFGYFVLPRGSKLVRVRWEPDAPTSTWIPGCKPERTR